MSSFDSLVNAARDFACGLYKEQPGALIPNIGETVLRFAWDKLCDYPENPGLPPPPASPFNGGQCENIKYRVIADIVTPDNRARTDSTVFGPVGGVRAVLTPDGVNRVQARYQIYCKGSVSNFTPDPRPLDWYEIGQNPNQPPQTTFELVSIARIDGQADNCGNPPAKYPDAPPPPPGGYTSPPVPIPLADGDNITVNFNFEPPSSPPGIDDFIPPIVINIIKPELKIPIEFNFNGEINLGTPSNPPATLPPNIINNINNTNNNTEEINNNFNDYRKDYDYYFNPPQLDNDPETTKEDEFIDKGKEEDKEGLVGLRIELTKLPDKTQFGSPNVYFAGWAAFKRDEGYLPREQINFADSFFLAPPGANGYTVTFTNGAQGNLRVYSRANES